MIKNKKELIEFIDNLNRITKSSFYFDDDLEDESIEGEIELSNDNYYIGITLDTDTNLISIYALFYYNDINKNDLDDSDEDLALELKNAYEEDINMSLFEKSFCLYLRAHSPENIVCTWDDECYGCLGGGYNKVGYSQIQFTEESVLNFVNNFDEFEKEFGAADEVYLRKYILERIYFDNGILLKENDDKLFLDKNTYIIFSDCSTKENNIDNKFLGEEYFLFKVGNDYYFSEILPVRIFEQALEYCEVESDTVYHYCDGKLYIISEHMLFQTNAYLDNFITQVEEMSILHKLGAFFPFATSTSKQLLEKLIGLIGIDSNDGPLLITEGPTDWKHMKRFLEKFKIDNPNFNLNFLEYEPANSKIEDVIKIDMGGQNLLAMCRSFSKVSLGRKFIFIADRDDPKIVKEFSSENKEYKDWGNNVYSIVLPIPDHRIETPSICIEHYYGDREIKTKFMCKDGVYRRLYLGNEFDELGRGINERLLCTKRNICGSDSIKIIDGSSDCKVVSFDASDKNNYALSKSLFEHKIKIQKNDVAYKSFEKLFKVIYDILNGPSANSN